MARNTHGRPVYTAALVRGSGSLPQPVSHLRQTISQRFHALAERFRSLLHRLGQRFEHLRENRLGVLQVQGYLIPRRDRHDEREYPPGSVLMAELELDHL